MKAVPIAALCALLVVAPLAAAVKVINSQPQTSIPVDPLAFTTADLPLDSPQLKRNVSGFKPEGVHLTQWTSNSVLVSWQTGKELIASNSNPPQPYDPSSVEAVVKVGTSPGKLNRKAKGKDSTVYSQVYGPQAGDTTYQSPIIHHVLLTGLQPATKYYYVVGNDQDGWSDEFSFVNPGNKFPMRLGLMADLGETANSSATLQHLAGNNPDMIVFAGDFTYADNHLSNNRSDFTVRGAQSSTYQPRWDAWSRLMEPVLSKLTLFSCKGNHEIEEQVVKDYTTFASANARFPYPQDQGKQINTDPNIGASYLNLTNTRQFINEATFQPNSAYYSLDMPGIGHIISLNNYIPWGRESAQYKWLVKDLAQVNREKYPWLIVVFHVPPYHTYNNHFKESDTFMSVYEELFYNHAVDMVFSGHVHAYERTNSMYKYKNDDCGPMYVTIGDGGNIEGLYKAFINDAPQNAYCANPSLFKLPQYQPTPGAQTVITLQDGQFCSQQQPTWSAFRQPTFGHGILELQSATKAVWQWHRNTDAGPAVADEATIIRSGGKCTSRAG